MGNPLDSETHHLNPLASRRGCPVPAAPCKIQRTKSRGAQTIYMAGEGGGSRNHQRLLSKLQVGRADVLPRAFEHPELMKQLTEDLGRPMYLVP